MINNNNNVYHQIYQEGLCCCCGLCKGICPASAIDFKVDLTGFLMPEINCDICTGCGICIKYCPGSFLTETEKIPDNFFYGYSNDNDLRFLSSSGGLATELLCYLLEKKIVSHVCVVGNRNNLSIPRFFITDDFKEIRASCTSKYCPVPTAEIMSSLKEFKGKIAITVLPCQAMAIKNYIKKNKEIAEKVKFIISLLCNHIPSYNATEFFLKQSKIDKSKVIDFYYRGDGWPGFIKVKTKETINKFSYRQACSKGFGLFFHNLRCQICNDHFGKYADISLGDAYFLNERENMDGHTFCIIRNNEMDLILKEMHKNNKITLFNGLSVQDFLNAFDLLIKKQHHPVKILASYKKIGRPKRINHPFDLPEVSFLAAHWIIIKAYIFRIGKWHNVWPLLKLIASMNGFLRLIKK